MAGHAAKFEFGEDHIISYLPLSHIAAQLVDIYAPMLYGATVWFAQPDALKVSCEIVEIPTSAALPQFGGQNERKHCFHFSRPDRRRPCSHVKSASLTLRAHMFPVLSLQGSLSTTMKEVRPTAFLGVPRVWEKMQEKMQEIARQNPSNLRKKIAAWAKDVGLRGNLSKMKG